MPTSKPADTKKYGLYEGAFGTPHLDIGPGAGPTSEHTSGPSRRRAHKWSEEDSEV